MSAARPRPFRQHRTVAYLWDEADRADELGRLDWLERDALAHIRVGLAASAHRQVLKLVRHRRRIVSGLVLPTHP